LRLGLEYVGPKTAWIARKYPFLHMLAETRELIAEIGLGNVGLVLHTWHWYHAGDGAADVKALRNEDVVAVDLIHNAALPWDRPSPRGGPVASRPEATPSSARGERPRRSPDPLG
jgi:sugar phosphate isomerase/epimerase